MLANGFDRFDYGNNEIDLGVLGSVKSKSVDNTGMNNPLSTLSYLPSSKEWNSNWSAYNGIVIISSVSPHKEFNEDN